ncbi:MAG: GHKL domain-containing protein [Leptospiraceae bacterium]|nr:GHKL domain-containing protein [Leptospiraceae bacterium]MCP5513530.1 GHKL domain-containing protein [Leptospiraceae bacterium]
MNTKPSYEYLSSLNKFKNELLSLNDPNKICRILEDFLIKNFGIANSSIHVWNEDGGGFFPYDSLTLEESKVPLFDPFLLWLTDHNSPLTLEEIKTSSDDTVFEAANVLFSRFSCKLILPLIMNSSLIGFILISSNNEEGLVAEDLNRLVELQSITVMSLSNATFYAKLISLTETLEQKVAERTKELEETQSQLIMSEKMASLGVMVAGIAHEINTPAGVISNSAENLEKNLSIIIENIPLYIKLYETETLREAFLNIIKVSFAQNNNKNLDARDKFKARRLTKEKLIQANLEPKLAEEITNFIIDRNLLILEEDLLKIAAVYGQTGLEAMKCIASLNRNLAHIQYSIKNIVRIVRALKQYSHLDQAVEEESNITEGIENTLIIMNNQLKHGIDVIKNFKEIPLILCNPDELNQVWTNLIQNSVHAMKGDGTLTLTTEREGDFVNILIEDSGPGISEAVLKKIWDPFFTTKDQGEGSGLGLGIVKGIIEKHKGKISVTSKPGSTVFKVSLPIRFSK